MMRKEINVLGLTRESSNTISNDIKRTIKAFERFNIQNFYILESDSTDNTLDELEAFHQSILIYNLNLTVIWH